MMKNHVAKYYCYCQIKLTEKILFLREASSVHDLKLKSLFIFLVA